MSTALYRRYRPQTFADVVGQEVVVRTLTNAILGDRVRQAYLFAGPRGTGKTSLARILAKALNCDQGPTVTPCDGCASCRSIAAGSSLDVIEMDAASQRGIDDVRELRERALLQPMARNKVYILDEAHQLTKDAFNALLKLIEEPPPHLVFVFCTTELDRMLPTVRSRCQTFLFSRPRLGDLAQLLRRIADREGLDVPDAALAQVARSARGSFRDGVSTLDQLASATGGTITVQAALQLLGAVEEESLFRLVDLVSEHDAAGALAEVDELVEGGQDLARLVTDLLEHLRQLMILQHVEVVPASLPVTEETRERLRRQADQVPPGQVLRLIDLLALAVEEVREGGDARLPLELALVKVARPQSERSLDAILQRLEAIEAAEVPRAAAPTAAAAPAPDAPDAPDAPSVAAPPPHPAPAPTAPLDLGELLARWEPEVLAAVQSRSVPASSVLAAARPALLDGDRLVLEFPATADFHRKLAAEPKHQTVLAHVLHEVTGRRLVLEFTVAAPTEPEVAAANGEGEPAGESEESIVSLFRDVFDAREVEEEERT